MKTLKNLNLEAEDCALLKARGVNLSEFIRNIIAVEVETNTNQDSKANEIARLKLQTAKLIKQLNDLKIEFEEYKKQKEQTKDKPKEYMDLDMPVI